jgi:stalled ribosome alternative rescue factor ArfA
MKTKAYNKALARMESEVKRAKAHVTLLKMLYREMQEQKNKGKIKA